MKYTPMHEVSKKEKTGLCATCGLSTKLPIHNKCGENHPTGHKKYKTPNYKELKICENVDCQKEYKPVNHGQKLCHDCVKLKRHIHSDSYYLS